MKKQWHPPPGAEDDVHSVRCEGLLVKGDRVRFVLTRYEGEPPHGRFLGYSIWEGEVAVASFFQKGDRADMMHRLRLSGGGTMNKLRGTIQRHGAWRQPWANEDKRTWAVEALRGSLAGLACTVACEWTRPERWRL